MRSLKYGQPYPVRTDKKGVYIIYPKGQESACFSSLCEGCYHHIGAPLPRSHAGLEETNWMSVKHPSL